jgi:carbonic anhydrase
VSLEVRPPRGAADWGAYERLARAYLSGLPVPVPEDYVRRELADLTVKYAPPHGTAFLAWVDGEPVGIVGVRPFGEGGTDAELKRMYVTPEGRGQGAGRLLAAAAIDAARNLGYKRLLLDTVDSMVEAIAIYRSLSFAETEPYRFNPAPGARYFALDL